MGLADKLHSVEKRYALPFLGFALAVIFGAITIYVEFIQEKNPHLRYVVGISSVFSVRDDVVKLDISLNGTNIRERKQMLSLVTLDVGNSGGAPVLKGSYDEREPLGLVVRNGTIVKAEVQRATSEYLSRNIQNLTVQTNNILFPPVIIEPGDAFSLRVLVLHDENAAPILAALGKVAGVREVEIVQALDLAAQPSFWKQVFAGSILIHFLRAIAYVVIFVLVGISIGIPIAFFSDLMETRKRRKAIKNFRSITDIELNQDDEFIFQSFLNKGSSSLNDIRALFKNQAVLKKLLTEKPDSVADELYKGFEELHRTQTDLERQRRIQLHRALSETELHAIRSESGVGRYERRLAQSLKESKFVSMNGETLVVNEHMLRTFEAFCRFLKSHEMLDEPHTVYTDHVTTGGSIRIP